jgi:DNA-binding MarR family transcriptional regulator
VAETHSGTKGKLEAAGSALFALQFIQAHAVRSVDQAIERAHETGLTGFEILLRLAKLHPDGASVRYLSDQVVVSPSRVSRVAEDLVRRGLLERAASPHDGRLALVRLTDDGRGELAAMEATYLTAVGEHLADHLTPDQVEALTEIGRALGAPHC